MLSNLLNALYIAKAAITVAPMTNTPITMSVIQSSSPDIEKAATQQTYIFAGYVILLLLTLIATLFLYKAGNKVQEAIKRDADARIEEAKSEAAKANERAQKLENDNLRLSQNLATLDTELAKQQERAAIAERALLELQEKYKPRQLTVQQGRQLVENLRRFAPQRIDVLAHEQIPEVTDIGNVLIELLRGAGWTGRGWDLVGGFPVSGIVIETVVGSSPAVNAAASQLVQELLKVSIFASLSGQHFNEGGPPPGLAVKGPSNWGENGVSPIRMHIGAKP